MESGNGYSAQPKETHEGKRKATDWSMEVCLAAISGSKTRHRRGGILDCLEQQATLLVPYCQPSRSHQSPD
jgi:hypothetical protein